MCVLFFQMQGESSPEMMPVFSELAPLHSRKHHDVQLSENQTSILLELCEGHSLEDCTTLAKVSKLIHH